MAPIRFIHTADLHLGASFGSLPAEVATRRRLEQRRALERIVELATGGTPRADLLLIAGDLFDSASPAPGDLARVHEAFHRAGQAGVRLFVVPGNHDEYRPGSFWDRAQLPAAHVFTDYAFSSCRVSELQLVVWGAAMNPARTGERLLASFPGEPAAAGRSILLFHGNYLSYGPDDAPRYSPFDIDEARRLPVHYVAFGHHHGLREVLSERTRRAFYCGSPEAVSFGTSELGDRFVIRGEIADDGTVSAEPLKINSAEHAVETFDCTHETPESLARRAGELARPDRLLKLRLTGVCSPEVADAAASIQAELAAQFAYLEVTSDVADVDLAAEGNPYLKSFREEALRQLQEAPPDRRAVLRRALEIGTLAFLRGHGGGGGRA